MTGLWLGIFLKRARKLIRFSATGMVEKVSSTMRGREEKLFVAESTRWKEATKEGKRKEGRKEERDGDRRQGDIVRAKPRREKCQKLREYLLPTTRRARRERGRRRRRRNVASTRRENRGVAWSIPSRRGKRGNKTNRKNETKPCRETQ